MELIRAVEHNDLKKLRDLLAAGCDVDYIPGGDIGYTALILAAYKGYKEAVEILIEAGADLTIADKDGTAKENAIKKGHKEIAEILEKAERLLEEGRWLKINSAEVANIQISHAINLKVTKIFNFSAMTLKEINKNTLTNAESSFILHFSDKAVDKRLLDKAKEVFVKDGGVIDEKEFRLAIRYNNKPAYRVIRS